MRDAVTPAESQLYQQLYVLPTFVETDQPRNPSTANDICVKPLNTPS